MVRLYTRILVMIDSLFRGLRSARFDTLVHDLVSDLEDYIRSFLCKEEASAEFTAVVVLVEDGRDFAQARAGFDHHV